MATTIGVTGQTISRNAKLAATDKPFMAMKRAARKHIAEVGGRDTSGMYRVAYEAGAAIESEAVRAALATEAVRATW